MEHFLLYWKQIVEAERRRDALTRLDYFNYFLKLDFLGSILPSAPFSSQVEWSDSRMKNL